MIAFLVILSLKTGWDPFIAGMVLVFVAFVLLFGSLTAEIRAGVLEIWFDIGLIRKRFALREIEDATPVKHYRIGTDRPEELAQAIRQSRRSGPSA
jgi:hypothetical protein